MPNPRLDSLIPAPLKARMRAAADSIAAGTLVAAPRPPAWRPCTGRTSSAPVTPSRELVDYLDEYLRVGEIPDEANAVNGLQVENSGQVGRIVAAVDASQATIDGVVAAMEDGQGRRCCWSITASSGMGTCRSPAGDIAGCRPCWITTSPLYAAHIPLDVHPEVGNNAVLAERLGIRVEGWFGSYRGIAMGVWGEAPGMLSTPRVAGARAGSGAAHAQGKRHPDSRAGRSGPPASASSPAAPET